jgi:hypothetical protein
VMSWWNMQTPGDQRMELIPGRAQASNVEYAWNESVKYFLDKTTSDYLFCVHDDVIAAPETLMRLLSWEKPLVTALTFMKQSPTVPHVWKSYSDEHIQPYAMRIKDTFDWFVQKHRNQIFFGAYVMDPRPDDALVEVDFTSTGCTVIRRDLLEALREPMEEKWFKWDLNKDGQENQGAGGEDRNFHEHARAIGMPGYVDRSCICGHIIGEIPASSADFIMWCSVSNFQNTGEQDISELELQDYQKVEE